MSLLDNEDILVNSTESAINDMMIKWAVKTFTFYNKNNEVANMSPQSLFKIVDYGGKKYINIMESVKVNPSITEFEYPIGVARNIFNINGCNLKSLKNGPLEVWGYMDIEHCPNLESLEGAPKYVLGNVYIIDCPELKTMDFYPGLAVGAGIMCHECPRLSSLDKLKIDRINMGICGYNFSTGSKISKYTGKRYI